MPIEDLENVRDTLQALKAEKDKITQDEDSEVEATKLALFAQGLEQLENLGEEIRDSNKEVLSAIENMQINVAAPQMPEINVPEARVTVDIPEIKAPEARVTVDVPEIKLPEIRVPKAQVDVKIPDIKVPTPQVTVQERELDSVELRGVDANNPLPVILRDTKGNLVDLRGGGGSATGGGSNKAQFDKLINKDPEDFYFEVAAERIPKHSFVHKFGQNPDIDQIDGFEAIWNGGGDYTGFDATVEDTIDVSSSDANDTSAGTGARTVELQGLDGEYREVSETVVLGGTSTVTTTQKFLRMHRGVVRTAGTGAGNAGAITAQATGTSDHTFMVLPIGYNQTMIAAYTVPGGKDACLTSWYSSLSGKTNANASIRLLMRPLGQTFQVKEEFTLRAAGSSYVQREYRVPKDSIPEKTDIKVMADTDANNTAIAAGFDLILIER